MGQVTLDHLVGRFEALLGDVGDIMLLMAVLVLGCDGTESGQWEVDPWVGHQICLELIQVHIESSVKSERDCDGGYDLGNHPVQAGVGWPLNLEVLLADVIDGLIVHKEGHITVLKSGVSEEASIVGFHNGCCNLQEI